MVGSGWRVVPVACAAALLLGGTALSQEAAARQDGRALCRELGRSGTAQDVPRLEALLADPSCADAARRALEQIPGDESLNALYGALDTAKGEPLIGVLSSLGERRDVRALPGIAEHLSSRGEGVRAAAIAAIGRIGGSRTGRRLLATESELPASAATQEALGHALLECADELRRAGEAEDARALYEALHDGRFPRAVRIGAFLGHVAATPGGAQARLRNALQRRDPQLAEAALRHLATPEGAGRIVPLLEELPDCSESTQERFVALAIAAGTLETAQLRRLTQLTSSRVAQRQALAAALEHAASGLENLARGALASSPDDIEPDHSGQEAPAAVDGDEGTYWDEVDQQSAYRILLTLPKAQAVSALSVQGWAQHNFAPRDFEVELDGAVVTRVRGARYVENRHWVLLPRTTCRTIELHITGYYGQSPAIRELGVFDVGEELAAFAAELAQGEAELARGIVPDEEYEKILAAAPAEPRVAPREPRRLLVYSRCFGFVHTSIPHGKVVFALMGEKSGAWEAELREDLEVFEQENLSRFDAILLNNTNNELFLPANHAELEGAEKAAAEATDARLKQNLLEFVAGGKGMAVIHAGVASFRKWPEFGELMGARFQNHPWSSGSTVVLDLEDPEHPVSAALRDGALPEITDEIYQLAPPFSRDDSRVLLSVDLAKTKVTPKQEATFLEARDFPMSYVRAYGKGRVFYNAFGHQHELFWNPVVLQHWMDGVQFVLGDLPGDTTPTNRMGSVESPMFEWKSEKDAISLLNGEAVVWRLNRDWELGKAYFHPLGLTDGTPLTWLSPPDHVWHRALWFEWKFIDGVNYWEDVEGKGLTEIVEMDTELAADFSARMRFTIDYRPPGGAPVMREERRVAISAPDEAGRYRIDWSGTFTSLGGDLLLDRTPPADEPDGKSWGGYAGMSVRLAQHTSEWRLTDSEGRSGMQCHRQPARWVHADFRYRSTGREAGVAILDSPRNPRHPTPSFIVLTEAQPFVYYSPAILFDGPYTLRQGEPLSLSYGILVHPGRAEREWLDEEWQAFTQTEAR